MPRAQDVDCCGYTRRRQPFPRRVATSLGLILWLATTFQRATMQNLVERLRVDFGRRTIGELIQDREAAAFEIERLTRELAQLRSNISTRPAQRTERTVAASLRGREPKDPRVLLRLREICEIVGLSRSSIYKAIQERRFPKPVHAGVRAVRWRSRDIDLWLNAKVAGTR